MCPLAIRSQGYSVPDYIQNVGRNQRTVRGAGSRIYVRRFPGANSVSAVLWMLNRAGLVSAMSWWQCRQKRSHPPRGAAQVPRSFLRSYLSSCALCHEHGSLTHYPLMPGKDARVPEAPCHSWALLSLCALRVGRRSSCGHPSSPCSKCNAHALRGNRRLQTPHQPV